RDLASPGRTTMHPFNGELDRTTRRADMGEEVVVLRLVLEMGDGTGKPKFDGRHKAGLAHAVGAVNQHHLRIERNDHRSSHGTEILDRERLQPRVHDCAAPSSSTLSASVEISRASAASTVSLPPSASCTNRATAGSSSVC